jgi:galactokinase
MEIQQLRSKFESRFKRSPEAAFRAPGRVNLIGEHTDYNDGFVLPIAINRETTALMSTRDDRAVRIVSTAEEKGEEFDLDGQLEPGDTQWINYCKGVAAGLLEKDIAIRGADILLDSTVPIGGGLSSSASLEVATALALMHNADKSVEGMELALLCQKAEHEFAGMPCGIMDQSICILGKKGSALLLDCLSGETKLIPFCNPDLVLLVCNTNVKHSLADGEYAKRRSKCFEAAEKLGVKSLRDTGVEMVEKAGQDETLSGDHLKRARHVAGEIDRTLKAVDALESGNYERFGELMYGSHNSLRDDYEVSCEELDSIVEIASGCGGVYGARMTGGGFGGCAIVLTKAASADAVSETISGKYKERFGMDCTIFSTVAAHGAGEI